MTTANVVAPADLPEALLPEALQAPIRRVGAGLIAFLTVAQAALMFSMFPTALLGPDACIRLILEAVALLPK